MLFLKLIKLWLNIDKNYPKSTEYDSISLGMEEAREGRSWTMIMRNGIYKS